MEQNGTFQIDGFARWDFMPWVGVERYGFPEGVLQRHGPAGR